MQCGAPCATGGPGLSSLAFYARAKRICSCCNTPSHAEFFVTETPKGKMLDQRKMNIIRKVGALHVIRSGTVMDVSDAVLGMRRWGLRMQTAAAATATAAARAKEDGWESQGKRRGQAPFRALPLPPAPYCCGQSYTGAPPWSIKPSRYPVQCPVC